MASLLLLDLDGTIREPLSGQKFIQHPLDQKIIAGADKAIAHYHANKWLIVGISNQGGVAAGHKSLEEAIQEQRRTLELFPEIQAIYFCPDYEGKLCYGVNQKSAHVSELHDFSEREWIGTFRKPGDGMLRYALACFDGDIKKTWYVGDRSEDSCAASSAGVNFIWANIWRNRFLPGIHEHEISPQQLEFLEKYEAKSN